MQCNFKQRHKNEVYFLPYLSAQNFAKNSHYKSLKLYYK